MLELAAIPKAKGRTSLESNAWAGRSYKHRSSCFGEQRGARLFFACPQLTWTCTYDIGITQGRILISTRVYICMDIPNFKKL